MSDLTYKAHLLRLSEAYTEYKPSKEMDYKNFEFPMMAPSGPAVELYGVKGLTRLSPRSQERENQERKKKWNSRFTSGFKGLHEIENMNGPKNSYSNSGSRGRGRGRSESPSLSSSIDWKGNRRASQSSSNIQSPSGRDRNSSDKNRMERSISPSKKKRPSTTKCDEDDVKGDSNGERTKRNLNNNGTTRSKRNACLDEEVTVEQLIMKGNYRFHSDGDKETYARFVDMLSSYDPYEMVKILEDAMRDAQEESLLDEYSGFHTGLT